MPKRSPPESRKHGFRIVSGGTDNHLMLVDLRPKEINGKDAQNVLDRAGITVNKNAIPFDTYPIFKTGGIRLGTPAVTTRGMKEEEMLEIADLLAEALAGRDDERAIGEVRQQVQQLTRRFPLPGCQYAPSRISRKVRYLSRSVAASSRAPD